MASPTVFSQVIKLIPRSEFFKFDEKQFIVTGDQGTIFRMGDVYKCIVMKTDLELKTIDYKIVSKVREMGKK